MVWWAPTDAGTLAAVMLVGGLFGAVIIPPFSDRQHKRKKFLLLGIVLAIPRTDRPDVCD